MTQAQREEIESYMKFDFELDGIDTQNLFGIFQSQSIAIVQRSLDIESGKLDYIKTEDIPNWMRGCINELLQLDRLAQIVSNGRFNTNYRDIAQIMIDRYGENQYDEDGEYTGHTEPTVV